MQSHGSFSLRRSGFVHFLDVCCASQPVTFSSIDYGNSETGFLVTSVIEIQYIVCILLTCQVLPLLDVHRTEEELKSRTGEVEALKAKIAKLEGENKGLKEDNDRYLQKVSGVCVCVLGGEVEALKAKIAKLEGENKGLKEDNDRYLQKVSGMCVCVCRGWGG